MADDRVFIQCNVCGKKLFLGKQFGWEAFYWENYGKTNGDPNSPPLEDRLNEFFQEHVHLYSDKEHWNGNYSIVYESDNDGRFEDVWRSNDSVEVVRCKYCEWHDKCRYEQHLGLEGFCSKGERREEDADVNT